MTTQPTAAVRRLVRYDGIAYRSFGRALVNGEACVLLAPCKGGPLRAVPCTELEEREHTAAAPRRTRHDTQPTTRHDTAPHRSPSRRRIVPRRSVGARFAIVCVVLALSLVSHCAHDGAHSTAADEASRSTVQR